MGELSAPAFDMMPDTTVSPMPEKISSPAPVAVLEEPAAEIQPEISGDFMPDTFPPEPSQAAPVPEHIPKPAKDASKPAEKTQKKKSIAFLNLVTLKSLPGQLPRYQHQLRTGSDKI